ncbi:MAG: hypothetical protein FWF78_00690 [Defluviitaleaceae bacterium]|nr:hypothetical protein [Defluviitaleaceae bacterium]
MGKVAFFEEIIGREVERRTRLARHKLAKELSAATAREVDAVHKRVCAEVAEAKSAMERSANKAVAEATQKAGAEYNALYTAFFQEIKDEVKEKLIAFTQTDEYGEYLKERIVKNMRVELFGCKILLRPQDMYLAEEIKKSTNDNTSSVDFGKEDFIGGFILRSEKMQVDCTFKTRLESFTSRFLQQHRHQPYGHLRG